MEMWQLVLLILMMFLIVFVFIFYGGINESIQNVLSAMEAIF